ncbi:unnamed protein product [Dimorphilus gyrociliatus]|uniref:Uncharacterized protein n=1 Tax=Dimorphilus gyrociliatus TaxID=2664684 RepID=A0A7I8VYK1_9ANNE|nr:unnamed protein product [Dimorphilus gyrociliatus]
MLVKIIYLLLLTAWAKEYDKAFDLLFTSNVKEFDEITVHFQKPLPTWLLNKKLIRIGAGCFGMGDRKFHHVFDGFGKMHIWNLKPNRTTFSAKFVRTRTFVDSEKRNTVSPLYTLFDDTVPRQSLIDRLRSLFNGPDNVNVNIVKFGDDYLAISDFWSKYVIDIDRGETLFRTSPDFLHRSIISRRIPLLSSSHPIQGVNIVTEINPFGLNYVHLVQIKSAREVVNLLSIPVDEAPYIHSFSLTSNYAIIVANPVSISISKLFETLNPSKSIIWRENGESDVYVVDLRTLQYRKYRTEGKFMLHHVNAFEYNDAIIFDTTTYKSFTLIHDYQLDTLRNSTVRNKITDLPSLKRYTIDLKSGIVKHKLLSNRRPYQGLEMPVINELYRFKSYCFIYGISFKSDNIQFSNVTLIKVDICGKGRDRIWELNGHIPSEPWFVHHPNRRAEDDGLLFSVISDGIRLRSYLAVFNATTLTLVNTSPTPTLVPMMFHGYHE